MVRLVKGILKGLVAGILVGGAAYSLHIRDGILLYAVYGAVGALVGVICGKALWKQETLWTPAIKAFVGFGMGAGLYWAWQRVAGDFRLPMAAQLGAPDAPIRNLPFLLGPAIGLTWGALVELDDGGSAEAKKAMPKTAPQNQ